MPQTLVRFPNCHECPVERGLGNLTSQTPSQIAVATYQARMLVTKWPSNEQAMLDNERNLALREWMLNQKEEEEEEREGLKEEQERKEKREDGRVAATGEEIRQEIVNRH